MIVSPRIIAVDDNIEHLKKLENAFDSLDGLCKCIEFATASEREKPFGSGVRVVFMDINLMPGAGSTFSPRTGSPVANVLRKTVGRDNGPYALVTWTENVGLHEQLIEFLQTNLEPERQPCVSFCLSKSEYLEDPEGLRGKIEAFHDDLPGLAMLLDWEGAVTTAADRSVFQIAKLSGKHGSEQGSAVAQLVAAIASHSAGRDESAAYPFRSFTQGMSALLADQMDHAPRSPAIEESWKKAIGEATPQPLGDNQQAALNTFFNFERIEQNDKTHGLGTVYKTSFAAISDLLKPRWKSSWEAITSGEFFPIVREKANTEEARKAFAKKCDWRLIALGAACDHTNKKNRIFEAVLGVCVEEDAFENSGIFAKKKATKFPDTPPNGDWLFQTPPFVDGENRFVLVANMRYHVGLPLTTRSEFEVVGRLREGLANELASHVANFSTRPGIIEFR